MERFAIQHLSRVACAGGISLHELFEVLLEMRVERMRVDLVRKQSTFIGRIYVATTDVSSVLVDVPILDRFDLPSALKALDRSRHKRISFAEFVIRIARSGFVAFTISAARNSISFEESGGEAVCVPVLIPPADSG